MMKKQSNCVPVQPGLCLTCRKLYDRFHVTNNYLVNLFKYLYAERERERERERLLPLFLFLLSRSMFRYL